MNLCCNLICNNSQLSVTGRARAVVNVELVVAAGVEGGVVVYNEAPNNTTAD